MELPSYLELNKEQNLEQEFQEYDVVRKFQIDYNETICMVEKFPEAMQTEGVMRPSGMDKENLDGGNLGMENSSDLCQNNTNTTEMYDINPTADMENLPALSQNNINTTEGDEVILKNCMEKLPDICQNNINTANQLHVVAPGEGKTPVSLTYCEDWDAKAFPMLHPDGQNHLTDERRKKKLSDLEYFKQRLFPSLEG